MKILSVFTLLLTLLSSCNKQDITIPDHIRKDFKLVWSDEFDGNQLDTTKWDYRSTGSKRGYGVVYEDNCYLDGEGHLVIKVTKKIGVYQIGQVGTQKKYLTTFGYFECRAKMNHELGPHMAFWLQSPSMGIENDNPAENGTEIDIFEYHLNNGTNKVYHNLHWNGYGDKHKHVGTTVQIEGVDEGFHTFALEWNENEYIFYVDGVETWRTNEAVSHRSEYMILSAELTGWGGDFSESLFPDEVTFDYVRVYQKE